MGIAAAAGIAGIASAGIGAVSSLAGGGKAAGGSAQSAQMQLAEYQQGNADQQPYIQGGWTGIGMLQNQLASGTLGAALPDSAMANYPVYNWNPTQAGLEQTPGYQFTLQQGLQTQQNAAAARGLGVSGAALKASDAYSTGLANQTYNQQLQNYNSSYGQQVTQFQNQFNNYWAQQTNRYNQLAGLAGIGENAAVGAGAQTVQSAANVGNAGANAASLSGQSLVGAGNAVSNALQSPTVQSALTSGYNYLTGGGSTINPATNVANANYENAQFAQNPGSYGPYQ